MADLDVGKLSITIEADGRAAIFEIDRVVQAAEMSASDAARAYREAGRDMADAFEPAAEAAEETGEAVKKVGDEAERTGDTVASAGQKSTKSLKETLETAEKFGTTMTTAVTAPLLALYGAMSKGASDLTETIGKTDVTFGEFADDMFAWSESSIENMGLAQGTALDMAATYGDMATGMGLAKDTAADMSATLTQLAADMASFKNASADRTYQALTGVFTGETEALKSLGVVMTQANLQAFALTEGITEQVSAMTQAEQVQLRYRYVLAQTANAQGDFARTGGNLANNSRALVQTLKQAGTSFGSILNPAINEGVTLLREAALNVAQLDEGTKTLILSFGGTVAAAGPLVLAGTKVLKLVTGLKAAVAGLSFGPVALGLTAVAAVFGLIYTNLSRADEEIDTTSEKYQRLKRIIEGGVSADVSVDTTEIDELDDNPITITIDADGQKALEKAQGILDELEGDEYTGVMTIDGDPEKAQDALDALESAVQALLSGEGSLADLQAAVDACEALVISPSVDEETRANVQAKLDELKGAIDGITDANVTFSVNQAEDSDQAAWDAFVAKVNELGWETKAYTAVGKFEIEENTLSNAEEYRQALVNAAAATDDYEAAVNNLNNLLDQDLAEKVTQINAQAAEQISYQARLLNSGIIDEETYNANVKTIIDGVTRETEALESQYEVTKQLNEQFDNSVRADDYEVIAEQSKTLSGGEGLREEDYQSAVATLTAAAQAGEDMRQYQAEAMIVNQMLAQQSIANFEAMTAAQKEYDAAIEAANEKIADSEANIQQAETLQAMVNSYIMAAKFAPDAETALANVNAAYSEQAESMGYTVDEMAGLQETLQQILTGTDGLMSGDEAYEAVGGGALLDAYQNELETAIQTAEAAKTTAAETFASTLEGLTSDFAVSEAQMLAELTASTGAALSEADAELVAGATAMMESMATAIEGGGDGAIGKVSEVIAAVGSEASDAESEGAEVGAAITAGITSGLSSGTGTLYATARGIVRRAIAEMKDEGRIESPSKETRDIIGKPLIQGIGLGAEEETPNVVRTIKSSVQSIMTGGASVVDHGVYTTPAVQSIAGGAPIDYNLMGEAMAEAVRQLKLGFSVGETELGVAMRETTARQAALRAHQINIGKGRIG